MMFGKIPLGADGSSQTDGAVRLADDRGPAKILLLHDADAGLEAVVVVDNTAAGPTIGARVVLQGANIPATRGCELLLHKRGILSVPDFIANAGGVICASVEHRGGTRW